MSSEIQTLLRQLPGVDRVLQSIHSQPQSTWPESLLTAEVQKYIAELRVDLLSGDATSVPPLETISQIVVDRLSQVQKSSLRPVINASGILLHTNLGRAPLAKEALAQIEAVAAGYSNLEMDLATGQRGSRHTHVEGLLCRLSGAEAAMVVNNNAGAVLLALTALGRGKEAIVSRGELVEIGGSFRIPEVMEAGGVTLREVGSSNRTHYKDYQEAVNSQTALLLKVHTSNYRVVGFTSSVSAAELAPLAKESGLPLIEDLGSGLLRVLPNAALPEEPTLAEAVASGVDLLTCSGDKLLGGPQAGLIFGRKRWIDKLKGHPFARALRIDKLSLAALEATLRLYLSGDEGRIPLMAYFARTPEELLARSQVMQQNLDLPGLEVEIVDDQAMVGGGAMPEEELPGPALAIESESLSLNQLSTLLRAAEPALVARIQHDKLLLNLRTVDPADDRLIVDTVKTALRKLNSASSSST